jgi:hypothetical protein
LGFTNGRVTLPHEPLTSEEKRNIENKFKEMTDRLEKMED